jgi:predicted nucleic acid-binding protein
LAKGIIVTDSSPLVALALVGQLELLDKLFKYVIIPETVYHEAAEEGKPGSAEIAAWGKGKLSKAQDQNIVEAFMISLDPGESEALAIYDEAKADYLLIDEKKGRKTAMVKGMNVIGSIGVLLMAKQEGLVAEVKPLMERLRRSTVYFSDSLLDLAISRAGESQSGPLCRRNHRH